MGYKKGSRNITEYTIGNKMFSTVALIATVLATNYGVGNSLIRPVETIYVKGIWYIMFAIGSGLIYDLSCLVVSHRIGLFMETSSHISMADTIGRVYGKIPRIITALASVSSSIVVMALQITVTSRALQACVSDVHPT